MNVKIAIGIIVGIAILVGIGYGVGNQNSEPGEDIESSIDDNTEADTQGKHFTLELSDEVKPAGP